MHNLTSIKSFFINIVLVVVLYLLIINLVNYYFWNFEWQSLNFIILILILFGITTHIALRNAFRLKLSNFAGQGLLGVSLICLMIFVGILMTISNTSSVLVVSTIFLFSLFFGLISTFSLSKSENTNKKRCPLFLTIILLVIITILLLVGFPLIEGNIDQLDSIFSLIKYIVEIFSISSVIYILFKPKKRVYAGLFIFVIGFFLMIINNVVMGNSNFILNYMNIYDYLTLIIIGIIYLASVYLIRKRFQEY